MISLIAAVAKNKVIGKHNDLPWYIPEDLKRFKEITTGKIVLMGRKTYESIVKRLGKPLPNRTSVVITHNPHFVVPEGVKVYPSVETALMDFLEDRVYVIGGGEIFKQTIDQADTLYITEVVKEAEGDVFFPEINLNQWLKVSKEKHPGFSFCLYKRIA